MQFFKQNTRAQRTSVLWLAPERIQSGPVQPRTEFSEPELEELAQSVKEFGILNPLTVRRRGAEYELIAGERRLRAAKRAGLSEVPCLALDVDLEQASLIALVENLQRKDLDFVEQARGIAQLIRTFGLRQEECARRLGKSQSAIANKLRLLRLPEDVLMGLRNASLTERHGRALLRLETPEEQRAALAQFIAQDMNVAAAEAYVEDLLNAPEPAPEDAPEGEKQRTFILKDVRVFLNSLTRNLELMKQGGIDAGMERRETEDALILTISIPKTQNKQPVEV
jgi:ParB family chromosome partitioning protein